ncbi:AraC family transcriptional regulator [Amycolatopsis thermoflava]|uniref:AraC family transcriptional regulator n=1 Tax=Amycolatopsis thermoflava TaxID=84480 RepID=UPI003D70E7BA
MGSESVLRAPASALLLTRLGMERGVPAAESLRGTGLRMADLANPDQPVTAAQEMTVIANLVRTLGDPPGLGLDAGLRYHLTTYGIWGFALISSPTLRSAISVGLRYLDLTYSFCRMTPVEAGDELTLVLDASAAPEELRRFLLERDAAAIHTIQRELLAAPSRLHRVSFAFAPPAGGLARYTEVFGLRPEFGAAADSVSFDRASLDSPLPQAEPLTASLAEAQCRRLLEQRRTRTGLPNRVREVLLGRPQAPPTVVEVASRLHLSPRTLRRRLSEEGTSYRCLLDEVREELADELLDAGRLTVEEVAYRLGYAETSSFTHAFRRWKGVSPRAHRRTVRAHPRPGHR